MRSPPLIRALIQRLFSKHIMGTKSNNITEYRTWIIHMYFFSLSGEIYVLSKIRYYGVGR